MSQYSYIFEAREMGTSRLFRTLDRIDKGVQRLVQITQRYGHAAGKTTVTINNYSRATKQAGNASSSFAKTMHRLTGLWNLYNRAVNYLVQRLSQLKRAFTAVQGTVLDVSKSWEPAIAQIKGLMSEGAEVAIQKAKDIGAGLESTAHSAIQASQGFVELARAGFNTGKEAAEALIPVLDFSTASMLSVAKSAKIGAVAMKQFAGESLRSIFETLMAGANQATTNVQELSNAFTVAAPAAKLLHMNALDLTTTLSLMAEKGIVSGKAGRYLNTALARLSAAPKAVRDALTRLNLSLKDLDLSNPAQWLETLRVAMAKIPTETEQLALGTKLFGQRAMVGLLPLVHGGAQGFTEMQHKILDAKKAMQDIKDEIQRGIVAAYTRLKNAIQTVYVSLKAVLDVPMKAYYDTLTSVVQTLYGRLEELGKRFKMQASDLESWIALVKKQGFKGLFHGVVEEARPEIEKLKKLFEAAWEGIKALGTEMWEGIFTDAVKKKIKQFARELGVEIAVGIKEGAAEGIQQRQASALGIDLESRPQEIDILTKHLDDLLTKKHELSQLSVMSEEDHAKLARLNAELRQTAAELAKLKWDPSTLGTMGSYYQDQLATLFQQPSTQPPVISKPAPLPFELRPPKQVSEADRALREEVQRKREQREQLREFQALPEAEQQKKLRELGRKGVRAAQEETVELSKEELDAQIQLTEKRKHYNEVLQQSKNALLEAKLTIIESGKEFAKWLLKPFDAFAKAVNDIKSRFDEMIAGFQQKKIDLAEKFGLVSTDKATAQRQQILEKQLAQTQRRIRAAALPEDQQALQEKASALSEKLAELTGDKQYAKQAMHFLTGAEKSALRAEDLEIKRVGIERKAAEESIPLYQGMLRNATTAGGAVEIMKALQANFKSLGKVSEAAQLQRDIQTKTIEAAKEQAEHLKMMATSLKELVEIARGNAESNKATATVAQRDPGIAPEPIIMGEG